MIADFILTSYMQAYMRKAMRFSPSGSGDEWMPPAQDNPKPLLLYLHIPFCEELCPFCSFNRVKFDPVVSVGYFESLRNEIRMYAELGYQFDSIYVGGGTPTIVPAELEATLRLANDLWPIKKISAETNPNHMTPEILALLRDLGVGRLSVGMQSADDEVLKGIGRYERYGSGAEILKRLALARGYFNTLNVDLIFNFPMQTEQMLRTDLRTVRSAEADQITCYPLMSPKARKEDARRDRRKREQSFYRVIRQELLGEYEATSAWCFSRVRPDLENADGMIDEYIIEYDDYAGLGSGSFGYLAGVIYSNTFSIPQYVERLNAGTLPIVARKQFSRVDQIRYDFLMKLFGGSLPLSFLKRKYHGVPILRIWRELLFFLLAGAIRIRKGEISLTEKGYYLWVVMMREFFTGVNLFREQCKAAIDPSIAVSAKRRSA